MTLRETFVPTKKMSYFHCKLKRGQNPGPPRVPGNAAASNGCDTDSNGPNDLEGHINLHLLNEIPKVFE